MPEFSKADVLVMWVLGSHLRTDHQRHQGLEAANPVSCFTDTRCHCRHEQHAHSTVQSGDQGFSDRTVSRSNRPLEV
jgi:hypothetical protein